MGNCLQENCRNNSKKQDVEEIKTDPIEIFSAIIIIQKYSRRFLAIKKLKLMSHYRQLILKEQELLRNRQLEPFILKNIKIFPENVAIEKLGDYLGQVNNGSRQGVGLEIQNDNSFYVGQWKDDKKNGEGRLFYSDGSYYEGQFENDIITGKGKFSLRSGTILEGNWKNGKLHGRGNIIQIKKFQEKKSTLMGRGTKVNFRKGQNREGASFGISMAAFTMDNLLMIRQMVQVENILFLSKSGEYYGKDGRNYKGNWKNWKMEGQGKYVWRNGNQYEGNFVNDLRDGFGEYIFENRKYRGDWKEGKQHGVGEVWADDQLISKGAWEMGKKISE